MRVSIVDIFLASRLTRRLDVSCSFVVRLMAGVKGRSSAAWLVRLDLHFPFIWFRFPPVDTFFGQRKPATAVTNFLGVSVDSVSPSPEYSNDPLNCFKHFFFVLVPKKRFETKKLRKKPVECVSGMSAPSLPCCSVNPVKWPLCAAHHLIRYDKFFQKKISKKNPRVDSAG